MMELGQTGNQYDSIQMTDNLDPKETQKLAEQSNTRQYKLLVLRIRRKLESVQICY